VGALIDVTPELPEAVRLWAGWGKSPMPSRDEKRVLDHFGPTIADQQLRTIKTLESEFYASDANQTAAGMAEMESLSMKHFLDKRPEVPADVAKVFAWCYTFDNR
jgi:enamine deaminase RidA (YjgF/YER057c/UK114 family)